MQISKVTIVFLILFTIISVAVTVGAIWNTNKNWTDQSSTVIIEGDKKSTVNSVSSSNLQINTVSGDLTELSQTYKTNAINLKS